MKFSPEEYEDFYNNPKCIEENNLIRELMSAAIPSDKPLLDLGAGNGLGYKLSPVHSLDYTGVDIDKDRVAFGRKNGIHLIHDDAFKYVKKRRILNSVISLFSIDYMNPDIIDAIYQRLKGTLFMIHYNKPYLNNDNGSEFKGRKEEYLRDFEPNKHKILQKLTKYGAITQKFNQEEYYYFTLLTKND